MEGGTEAAERENDLRVASICPPLQLRRPNWSKVNTPLMEEATVGRGGVTEDSWSELGLVLSAHVGHRAAAVRVAGGLTLAVVDGFWWDLVFGVVWLDGVGQLVGVKGQGNPLHVMPIIIGFRSCRKH